MKKNVLLVPLTMNMYDASGVCNDLIYNIDLDQLLASPTGTPDYAEPDDIESVDFAIDGTVVDWATINSCFRKSEKTNVNITLTFTGKRNTTDPAQIAIAATAFLTGSRCRTTVQITDNQSAISITVPVVINVTSYAGGNGDDISGFAFEAKLNGEPTIA